METKDYLHLMVEFYKTIQRVLASNKNRPLLFKKKKRRKQIHNLTVVA